MKTLIKWLGIALLILMVLGGGLIALYHTEWFEQRLAARASEQLGRQVTIEGELGLDWGWPPGFSATQVRVANASWSDRPHMLELERLLLRLDLFALLQGQIVLTDLRLVEPRLLLERSPEGQANWAFLRDGGSGTGKTPQVRSVVIDDGRIVYAAPAADTHIELGINNAKSLAQAGTGEASALRIVGEGRLRGEPISLSADAGALSTLLGGEPQLYPLKVEASSGETQLRAQGHLSAPMPIQALALDFTLEGPDPRQLASLLGYSLSSESVAAYRVSGHLAHDDKHWALQNLSGSLGDAPVSGHIELDRASDQVDALLSIGKNQARVQGTVSDVAAPSALDLRFSLDVPVPRALAPVLKALPGKAAAAELPPYRIAGHLIRDEKTWALRDLEGFVARARLSGHAVLERAENRLDVALMLGENRAEAQGSLGHLDRPEIADLTFELKVPRPDALNRLLGALPIGLPYPAGLPAYRIRGRVKGDAQSWRLDGLDGSIGGLALSGDVMVRTGQPLQARGDLRLGKSNATAQLAIQTQGQRPMIQGKLSSQILDVGQLRTLFGGKTNAASSSDDIFPDTTLYVDSLRHFDAALSYKADKVLLAAMSPGRVELDLKLDNGKLVIEPLAFSVLGGRMRMQAEINGREPPVQSSIRIELSRMSLRELLAGTSSAGKASGLLDGQVRIAGQGRSLDALLAGASGAGHLELHDGRMDKELVDKFGLELWNMLIASSTARVPVRCGLAQWELNDGTARVSTLVIATPASRIIGRGKVNLANGAVDLSLKPHSRNPGLFELAATVHIGGSLGSPAISTGVDVDFTAFDAGPAAARCPA